MQILHSPNSCSLSQISSYSKYNPVMGAVNCLKFGFEQRSLRSLNISGCLLHTLASLASFSELFRVRTRNEGTKVKGIISQGHSTLRPSGGIVKLLTPSGGLSSSLEVTLKETLDGMSIGKDETSPPVCLYIIPPHHFCF